MRPHPARALYDQVEDTLMSLTLELRSAIQADGASGRLHRASGWARKVATELGSVLLDTHGIGLDDKLGASKSGGIAAMRAGSRMRQGSCEVAGMRNAGTTVTASLPIPRAP